MLIRIILSIFTLIFSFQAYAYQYDYTEVTEIYQTKSKAGKTNTQNTMAYFQEPPAVVKEMEPSYFSYYPYIGFNIGKVTGEMEHDNILSFPKYAKGFSISNRRESSLHGMGFGATLGYAVSYKSFYAAIEGFYNKYQKTDSDFYYANAESTRPDPKNPKILTSQEIKVTGKDELTSSHGINLKLGYFIRHDFLPYFIIGYSKSNYKSKISSPNTDLEKLIQHGHEFLLPNLDTDFSGIQYGLGMKYFITPNFSLSADYVQADYKTKTITHKTSWYTKEFKLTPYKYDFQLGAQYNF